MNAKDYIAQLNYIEPLLVSELESEFRFFMRCYYFIGYTAVDESKAAALLEDSSIIEMLSSEAKLRLENSLASALKSLIKITKGIGLYDKVDLDISTVVSAATALVEYERNTPYTDRNFWLELLRYISDLSLAIRTVEEHNALIEHELTHTVEVVEIIHMALHIHAMHNGINLFELYCSTPTTGSTLQ